MTYREQMLRTRRALIASMPAELRDARRSSDAAEGGCGVLGLASQTPVAGRHVLSASRQMHNRGNGKGGGIAMGGLDPAQVRVDAATLRSHNLLQIALLDQSARAELEAQFVTPFFDVAQAYALDHVADFRDVKGLELQPPEVLRYFVRVKAAVLDRFIHEQGLSALTAREAEDEFIYQNSFRLNTALYASLGEKRAFVLSHARDLHILKIVGYAEQVVEYYLHEEQTAKTWIAHQRYPTKGRVWHPGGAHPFIGMNETLVHNGDFANYHAVSEYLRQRDMLPLFLTDTEVSVLLFDLLERVYRYPLEVTLEAMAPTTEHDFAMLPAEKQALYRVVQAAHMHGSPDGPWFFILARSRADAGEHELLGITDTSMLRPQVFALYENAAPAAGDPVKIGLIASERQAINACLRSLSAEDSRFQPVADRYWNARGGSHTDGGSFRFTVSDAGLVCLNKFGQPVELEAGRAQITPAELIAAPAAGPFASAWSEAIYDAYDDGGAETLFAWASQHFAAACWPELSHAFDTLRDFGLTGARPWAFACEALTLLRDWPLPLGSKKRASLLAMLDRALLALFDAAPGFDAASKDLPGLRRLVWPERAALRAPAEGEITLLIDVLGFPPEGQEAAARFITRAHGFGWQHIIAYNWRGGRFAASGLGAESDGLRLDLYGDVGDYTASGLDGADVHLHGAGQDQLGQIMRRGRLVIHGDVGQTFLYGAKGGEVYVRGSAAGRPLINAVGKPRVLINGTCLDYLAESFMAGDPLKGGGFAILNGVRFDEDGQMHDLETPYPGGNLFSLASGGAIYLRDPRGVVSAAQLNGGAFTPLTDADWALIEPCLRENERLFGISVEALLTVDGLLRKPAEVYRKVAVQTVNVALAEKESR